MTTSPFTLRPATPADCDAIAALIYELAVYEKLESLAKASGDDLRRNMFGPRPFAEAIVAEVSGKIVGFALFFHTFSTFRGQPGLWLEDIYVQPAHRGAGIGKGLLAQIAALAIERKCGRVEWMVLDWNAPSIAFYRSLGAGPMDDWTTYRLTDGPLERLASIATTANASEASQK